MDNKRLVESFEAFEICSKNIFDVGGFFSVIADQTNLTLKETVIIIISAYVFGFVAFIGYVKVEFSQLQNWPIVIVNYGFLLEWLQIKSLPKPMFRVRDVVILPVSLTLDTCIFLSSVPSRIWNPKAKTLTCSFSVDFFDDNWRVEAFQEVVATVTFCWNVSFTRSLLHVQIAQII